MTARLMVSTTSDRASISRPKAAKLLRKASSLTECAADMNFIAVNGMPIALIWVRVTTS